MHENIYRCVCIYILVYVKLVLIINFISIRFLVNV